MRVFADEFSDKVGISQMPDGYDLTRFGDMTGFMDITKEAGCRRVHGVSEGLIPQLHYQRPRQRGKWL